jgi:hypothetical protein
LHLLSSHTMRCALFPCSSSLDLSIHGR